MFNSDAMLWGVNPLALDMKCNRIPSSVWFSPSKFVDKFGVVQLLLDQAVLPKYVSVPCRVFPSLESTTPSLPPI